MISCADLIARILGTMYRLKEENEKSIHHSEMALLFYHQGEFDDAYPHIKQAKSHTTNNAYNLGRGMEMQARIWDRQHRLEEARSEVLGALGVQYERVGAARDGERCSGLLRRVEKSMGTQRSGKLDSDGGFSNHDTAPIPVNSVPC